MIRPAAFILCPGRGSYGKAELGSLARGVAAEGAPARDLLAELENLRAHFEPDLPSLTALDAAGEFRASIHLRGRNASSLIFACSLVDALRARRESRPVLIGGNSLGFYTALVVAGALSVADGYRLVATMADLQESGPAGGQVLWSLLDDDWHVVSERVVVLDRLLQAIANRGEDHAIDVSIRLGGHVVLAGTEAAVLALLAELPPVRVREREFPFRLPFHGPFHTRLLEPVARAARSVLGDLEIGRPKVPLIDGRGYVWSPLWTAPGELLTYTLRTQVTETFDFSRAVRTGLLDWAPDCVELLGPGTSLRAPVGHVEKRVAEGAEDPWATG